MAVSGFTGKILAGQGSLGTITTGALAMVPGFNAIGLAVGRSMGQVDKFGESEVPISAVADSLRKLNAEPQRLAESWSKMTANMDSSQIDSAKSKLVELGAVPRPSTMEEFAAYMKDQEAGVSALVKSGLLKPE